MPEMMEVPPDVIVNVCHICGFGLYQKEIAGSLENGLFIDYESKNKPVYLDLVFCRDCKNQLKDNIKKPVEDAAIQRASLEEDDRLNKRLMPTNREVKNETPASLSKDIQDDLQDV